MSYKYVNKKINEKEKRKLYKCLKLSIATAGIYIVALATGFALVSKDKTNSKQETVIETIDSENTYNTITAFEPTNYFFNNHYCRVISLCNDDLELYKGTDALQEFDIKCTPSEFAEIIDATDVTYRDVLKAIQNNSNIDLDTKTLLHDAIIRAESKLPYDGISLAALKYNLSNLKIKYVSEGGNYFSRFNPYECCVYINKNYARDNETNDYSIVLGAIGYGMTNAYAEIGGKKVLCSTSEYYYCADSNYCTYSNPEITKLGMTFEDGFATIITSMLIRDGLIDCSDLTTYHSEDAYIFQTISRLCNKSLDNYQNGGCLEMLNEFASQPGYDYMAYYIKDLENVDISKFSTLSKVILPTYINLLYIKTSDMDSIERKKIISDCVYKICMLPNNEYTITSGFDSKGVAPDRLINRLDSYIESLFTNDPRIIK